MRQGTKTIVNTFDAEHETLLKVIVSHPPDRPQRITRTLHSIPQSSLNRFLERTVVSLVLDYGSNRGCDFRHGACFDPAALPREAIQAHAS
jgi:hypothetical protein